MMKNEEGSKEKYLSGSRLRDDVTKIFDCFLIVGHPNGDEKAVEPDYKYPSDYNDVEVLQQSYLFCFPFDSNAESLIHFKDNASDFTFILTDIEGKHRFGFCKLTNEGSKCYCFLSFVPWFEIFYKVLTYIHELWVKDDIETMETLVMELYQQSVPNPLEKLQISPTLSFFAPDINSLPSIPENRNLSEYYAAVNPAFMMEIFASLMFERRVIFTSNSLSVLTSCIHSAESLLNPLHWQHIFIPVMPPHLLDYCLAPMPYLVGVHSSLLKKVLSMISMDDDIILANIDKEEIETSHNDVERMPNDTMSFLKAHLRKSTIAVGNNLSKAFLRTQARLIGDYRNGLRFRPGEPIAFDEDKFIDSHRSTTAKEFARSLVQLQTFKQFVDGRLDMLNAGIGFRDDFENEVNMLDAAGGWERDTYKEWLVAAKKGGNKLIMQFHRKAKDNMKVAQQSIKNYIKQQQLNKQASIEMKKNLNQSTKRIRPSRPPPIPPERLAELKARQNLSPPPRPPPPRVPLRKKKSIKRTRCYTEIELDDAPGTSTTDDESTLGVTAFKTRARTSTAFSELDLNLLADIEHVMNEKITKLKTPTNEKKEEPELLLDIYSSDQEKEEVDTFALTEPSGNPIKKRTSEIRRGTRVTSRPNSIRKSSTNRVHSSDTSSPEHAESLITDQLIDLSLTSDPQVPVSVPSDILKPKVSDDLLGLDISSMAANSEKSKSSVDWFNVSQANDAGQINNFDPFSSENTRKDSMLSQTFPSVATADKNPFRTSSIAYQYSRNPSSPAKFSPEKLKPFLKNNSGSVAGTDPNYSEFRATINNSNTRDVFSESSSPVHFIKKHPIHRTNSSQTIPTVTNKFLSNVHPGSSSTSLNRGNSHRHYSTPNSNADLFSDLLGSWKSREGL